MKKFLLVSLFTLSLASFGQTDNKQLLNPDSLVQKTDELKDSIPVIKPSNEYINIDQNMRYIQEIQKKNNEKKKKAAMMRILLGGGFLIILIIGLRRKRKPKAQ